MTDKDYYKIDMCNRIARPQGKCLKVILWFLITLEALESCWYTMWWNENDNNISWNVNTNYNIVGFDDSMLNYLYTNEEIGKTIMIITVEDE